MSERATVIIEQLGMLCDEERRLIATGRLERLEPVTVRRGELWRQLLAVLPPAEHCPGSLREQARSLRQRVIDNVALLSSLRDELAAEIGTTDDTRRATAGYARAARL